MLCLVNTDTEHEGAVSVCEQLTNEQQQAVWQEVLHAYSDLGTVRTIAESAAQTLTLRIPHKRGSHRHFTWLTMRPSVPTSTIPLFHGGQHGPKAVTKRQMPTELCRLCRLII